MSHVNEVLNSRLCLFVTWPLETTFSFPGNPSGQQWALSDISISQIFVTLQLFLLFDMVYRLMNPYFQGIHLNNNGHSGEDLDPDEVWPASDLDGHRGHHEDHHCDHDLDHHGDHHHDSGHLLWSIYHACDAVEKLCLPEEVAFMNNNELTATVADQEEKIYLDAANI